MPQHPSLGVAISRFTENNQKVTEPQARELVELAMDEDAKSSKLCGLIKGKKGTDALQGIIAFNSDRFEKDALPTVWYFFQHKGLRPL